MPGPIRLGDRTTGGGVVISCQLSVIYTIYGIPGAVEGDMATCVKHKGMFPFVESDRSTTFYDKGVVLQGHKLACGCHAISSVAVSFNVEPTTPAPSMVPPSSRSPSVCLDCLAKAAASGASTVVRG